MEKLSDPVEKLSRGKKKNCQGVTGRIAGGGGGGGVGNWNSWLMLPCSKPSQSTAVFLFVDSLNSGCCRHY